PALPLAAELRRRAVHRPARQVRAARGHDQGLPGDHRGQARRASGAGVLHGRHDRPGGREGTAARGRRRGARGAAGRARRGARARTGRRSRRRLTLAATFSVSLVTPEGPAFEGDIEMLIVPGADGEFGVLARHAPLVALLNAGSTRVYRDRSTEDVLEFATGPGFFKVEQVERDFEELVAAQRQAGLDLLADGMLRWQDHFRPLLESADGLETGALTRFLDTNTFYRAPKATGEPRLREPLGERYVAQLPGPRLVTLPSPFALSHGTDLSPKEGAEGVLKPVLEGIDAELVVLGEPFL